MLERSNSLEAMLQLLQRREKVFDESPISIPNIEVAIGDSSTASAQQVHHAFSDILGEEASLVSRACHMVTLST
jgi:hypothetical protein